MAFYNPFRESYARDPYPELARLQASEPVHPGTQVRDWIVTGFEEAQRCLQDDDCFSNDPVHERGELGAVTAHRRHEVPLGQVPILGQADAPEHTRLRAVVNRAFTPRKVESLRERFTALADVLLERADPSAPFEIMRGFAEPLPVMAVLEMIGIPPPDHPRVREWSGAIMAPIADAELPAPALAASARANRAFDVYLQEERDRLAAYRDGSVVMTLLAAADAGELSLDEVIMMIIHVSLSGNGPTAFMLGNGVLALAEHPEARAALSRDPSLFPNLVEEVLRFDSPTHHVIRFARQDLVLRGKRLRKGESVHVIIGAANRDPRRFQDPDVFDVNRGDVRHLSFGHGIHFCLGAPVARLLGAVAFERFLARFGDFRIVPNGLERGDTFLLRGPRRLTIEATSTEC